MIKYFAIILACLCGVASAQNARVTDSERIIPSGLSYPLLDTLKVVGAQVSYTRSFPIVSAEKIGIRLLVRGMADSVGLKIKWELSPGDTIYADIGHVVADSVFISGAGNDTTITEISSPPNYMMRARFRIEGYMEAGDSCKVTVDAVRSNKP